MSRTFSTLLRTLLVLALSLTLAGCGGGEDQPPSESADAPTENTDPPEESEEPEEPETSESDDAQAYCDAVDVIAQAETQLNADRAEAGGDPAAVAKVYKKFASRYKAELAAVVDSAPADIKASAEAYVKSYELGAAGKLAESNEASQEGLLAIGYYRENCS